MKRKKARGFLNEVQKLNNKVEVAPFIDKETGEAEYVKLPKRSNYYEQISHAENQYYKQHEIKRQFVLAVSLNGDGKVTIAFEERKNEEVVGEYGEEIVIENRQQAIALFEKMKKTGSGIAEAFYKELKFFVDQNGITL